MKGTRVVFTEPGVLEGVRTVDFVCVGEEEPEVAEGLVRDEFKMRKGVLVSGGSSKVSNKGSVRDLGEGGRPYGGGRVVEAGWHC
jgi:hypothetical protein